MLPSALTLLALLTPPVDSAVAADPIDYTLTFPDAQNHYVDVEARFPAAGQQQLEVRMAVWTPGSYLIREYSRHIERLSATSETGQALPVRKTRKNRWQIDGLGGATTVVLRYRVYGREMSVRTNWIETDFALINGAPTFITLADPTPRPHRVMIERAPAWKTAHTQMPEQDGRFVAANFDILVDSPILLGDAVVQTFTAGEKPHLLVDVGGGDIWDSERAAADVARIVETQLDFWGSVPIDRYVFLNVISETRGGLEHLASTVLMTSRWNQRVRSDYLDWLRLVSHEYFHTWNVKRLRPVELGPFDYERENYSRSLWIAEGITSYYDALLLHRAGLSTVEEYLGMLSRRIEHTRRGPGRHVRSLEDASFDAWIKFYRPDENSVNSTVSYYGKGAVVAWLLDARIRAATGGKKSLDDVMKAAYQRYSGERGFRTEAFEALASEVAGVDLGPWFDQHTRGVSDLDFTPALEWLGLTFGDQTVDPEQSWLGVSTAARGGRLVVTEVLRDGPAWQAGFNVGDEIVALDGYRVPVAGLGKRLAQYRPGTRLTALLARREKLVERPVILASPPVTSWSLAVADDVAKPVIARRAAWLQTPAAPAGKSNR